MQSLDLEQMSGKAVPNATIESGKCDPLRTEPSTGKAYYPCGLVANSQFNDSIGNPLDLDARAYYSMTDKGIAWDSDKELIKNTEYQPWQVVPPPYWHNRYPNGYNATNMPKLHEDEHFMVWMRTAGLPTFSKLYKRNDVIAMPAAVYELDIVDSMFSDIKLLLCC